MIVNLDNFTYSNTERTAAGQTGTNAYSVLFHTGDDGVPWVLHTAYAANTTPPLVTSAGRIRNFGTANANCLIRKPALLASATAVDMQVNLTYVAAPAGSTDLMGVIYNLADSTVDGYYVGFRGPNLIFGRAVSGVINVDYVIKNTGLTVGRTYNVRVIRSGNSHTIYLDGVPITAQTNSTYTGLGVGVLCFSAATISDASGVHLDRVRVEDPTTKTFVAATNAAFDRDEGQFEISGGTIISGNRTASTRWTTDSGYIEVDLTGTGSTITPTLFYSVNGGPRTDVTIAAAQPSMQIFVGQEGIYRDLEFGIKTTNIAIDVYTNASNSVAIAGIRVDPTATVTATPGLPTDFIFQMGDSNLFGIGANGTNDSTGDSLRTFGWFMGKASGLKFSNVGSSAAGYTITVGQNGQPKAATSIQFLRAGVARTFSKPPKIIRSFHGINDYPFAAATVTSEVIAFITAARALAGSLTTRIEIFCPPNGSQKAAISQGVTNYKAANPSDTLVFFLDGSAITAPFMNINGNTTPATNLTVDGFHLGTAGHPLFGAICHALSAASQALGTISFPVPSALLKDVNRGDDVLGTLRPFKAIKKQ